jgi:hypothetical protein
MGHVVHFDASRARNVDAPFFMLRWARCSFRKKHVRTHYAEHGVLHPMASSGHIVDYGAFGARNIDAQFSCSSGLGAVSIKRMLGHVTLNLCFCIRWDLRAT